MPLKLTNIERREPDGFRATYNLTHSTPGREGTTLTEELILDIYPSRPVIASISIGKCPGFTTEEALIRLSSWLRRLADSLDQRGPSIHLPL
jgi:hypothetical protein